MKKINKIQISLGNSNIEFTDITYDGRYFYLICPLQNQVYRCSNNGSLINNYKIPVPLSQSVFSFKSSEFFAISKNEKNRLYCFNSRFETSRMIYLASKYHSTYPIKHLRYLYDENCLVFDKGFFRFSYYLDSLAIKSEHILPTFPHRIASVGNSNYILPGKHTDIILVEQNGYILSEIVTTGSKIIDICAMTTADYAGTVCALTKDNSDSYFLYIISE